MSNVEQGENHAAMQQLKEEIRRLRQSAAEKIAGLVGMTTDESERYRERNNRIKSLTSQLAVLDSEREVALHEQNETQAIEQRLQFRKECGHSGIVHGRSFDEVDFHDPQR
jgi:hypothetical protein